MQFTKGSAFALFLSVSALNLSPCAAQEALPTTAATEKATETAAAVTTDDEVEAQMSLNEIRPPIDLRGYTSRASVYLPLQLALHAEPALQEQTLARQKTNDLMYASNAANSAQMLHAATVGFANSLNSPTSNALFGAAVGFEVMDALFGAKSDRDLLKEQYRSFRDPSLHLVSLKKPDPNVDAIAALKQHFAETTKVLAGLDLQCEPLQVRNKTFFTGKQLPRGAYSPGNRHNRDYLCGYPSPMEIGGFRQEVEKRRVEVVIFPKSTPPSPYDGGSLATVTLNDMPSTKGIKRILDPQEQRNEEDLPKLAFERIKGRLTPGWFAVFTIPSDDKKRHVIVAHGEEQIELVLPEMR